jgi:hypothetical protein
MTIKKITQMTGIKSTLAITAGDASKYPAVRSPNFVRKTREKRIGRKKIRVYFNILLYDAPPLKSSLSDTADLQAAFKPFHLFDKIQRQGIFKALGGKYYKLRTLWLRYEEVDA